MYQERNDVVQKLSVIERALCSSEDECSLLRDQLFKTQQQVQEMTTTLNAKETKYSELAKQLQEAQRQIARLEQKDVKISTQVKQLKMDNEKSKDELAAANRQNFELMAQIKCYENIPICEEEEDECQDNRKWDVMSFIKSGKFEYQNSSNVSFEIFPITFFFLKLTFFFHFCRIPKQMQTTMNRQMCN